VLYQWILGHFEELVHALLVQLRRVSDLCHCALLCWMLKNAGTEPELRCAVGYAAHAPIRDNQPSQNNGAVSARLSIVQDAR
jgi:hypothetical protein